MGMWGPMTRHVGWGPRHAKGRGDLGVPSQNMQLQNAAATWQIQMRSWVYSTCYNDSAFCQVTLVVVLIVTQVCYAFVMTVILVCCCQVILKIVSKNVRTVMVFNSSVNIIMIRRRVNEDDT